LAYSIHVRPRATIDIDVLIKSEDWEKTRSAVRALGYQELASPMTFKKGQVVIRRLTKFEKGGSDFMILDFLLAEKGVLSGALKSRVAKTWERKKIWLVSREGIVKLKRLRLSKQDRLDIEEIRKVKKEK